MSVSQDFDVKLPDGRTGHVSHQPAAAAGQNYAGGFFTTQSGVTLRLLAVPPMALAAVRKRLTAPQPPIQTIDGQEFTNESHPDYLEKLARFEEEVEELSQALYIELGIDDSSLEMDMAEVTRLREGMRRPPINTELNGSDKVVYVSMVLIPDPQEYARLIAAIQEKGQPTQENISLARQTFRPDVQG